MTDTPDPTKVKVQLNIPITWEWMAHLDRVSERTHTSKSQLVRAAIEEMYPIKTNAELAKEARQSTRDAGATR